MFLYNLWFEMFFSNKWNLLNSTSCSFVGRIDQIYQIHTFLSVCQIKAGVGDWKRSMYHCVLTFYLWFIWNFKQKTLNFLIKSFFNKLCFSLFLAPCFSWFLLVVLRWLDKFKPNPRVFLTLCAGTCIHNEKWHRN